MVNVLKVLETAMFEIFINELIKCSTDKQSHIYIDRLNKLMNNGSILSRRVSLDISYLQRVNTTDDSLLIGQRLMPNMLNSQLNKRTNKILKLPNFSDCAYEGYEIVNKLTKELEVYLLHLSLIKFRFHLKNEFVSFLLKKKLRMPIYSPIKTVFSTSEACTIC